jgi:deoxyribodipyrimidine photolyase
MQKKDPVNQSEFLEELITILNQSTVAYRQYLEAGKTFQLAQQLKLHNNKALKLLADNKYLLSGNLQNDAHSLITHYTEWSEKWEKLAAEKDHSPNDIFVFANDVTFPREAAQNLEAAYKNSTPQR